MGALLRLLSGILLLFFGRSLFWLFVAIIGFLAGFTLGARAFPHQPEWVVIVAALVVGIVGAVLALAIPGIIGAIAGFVAGGYLALTLLELVDLSVGQYTWVAFVIGGIVGAIIVLALFDWALIGLSSLAGAVAITNVVLPHGALALLVAGVLFVIGVVVQARVLSSRQPRLA